MSDKYPWQQREAERTADRKALQQAATKHLKQIKKSVTVTVKQMNKIRPISQKMATALKIYSVLAKDYLRDHPKCECGRLGCNRASEEIHHTKGRGKFLCAVDSFKALSRICHRWTHDNHALAKALGLFLPKK
jgi:hypothetical protein